MYAIHFSIYPNIIIDGYIIIPHEDGLHIVKIMNDIPLKIALVKNDIEEVKDLSKCNDPIKRLIVEWCLDDKGINMLYKNNGTDRYPDFKLYKMIARCVHNHTPQAQLERPEFEAFSKFKGEIPEQVINIDNIPSYV